jgi:hypothetical protein
MNNELGRMWENVVTASFEILFRHVLRGNEEEREETGPKCSVIGPIFGTKILSYEE